MVRDFVKAHSVGLQPESVQHLRDTIDSQLADLIEQGRKAGRDAFECKPRKLAKRITRSVRRDLTPPDDDRTNGHPE